MIQSYFEVEQYDLNVHLKQICQNETTELFSLSFFLGTTSLRVTRSNYRFSTNIDYRVGLSALAVSVAMAFPVIEWGNTGIVHPRDDL